LGIKEESIRGGKKGERNKKKECQKNEILGNV
jgi:hypothetical protein